MTHLDEQNADFQVAAHPYSVKPAEIADLSAILDDIRPHIHPSCSLHLLALCPPFISGTDGDLAYAHGFHHAAVLDETRDALIQLRPARRAGTPRDCRHSVCEGGVSRIVGAARNDLADLILLATPGWTASRAGADGRSPICEGSPDCPVLVLAQPQRPADGLPISLCRDDARPDRPRRVGAGLLNQTIRR